MAMMRYSSATIVEPCVDQKQWVKNCGDDGRVKVARTVLARYTPNKYLLSHCTIIAAVDTELANPSDPNSDYFIHPAYSKFINNNGDAWSKSMLASCYRSFVGSNNYLEHVQIPELSKGKVIDAILREVPIGKDKTGKDLTTYYVDILVATERKHSDLIRRIEAKELSTLSMGCKIAFSICSKCGTKAADETEACQHVRFEKNNSFYDDQGTLRKVGELCGHPSEPDSVTFIDASWVENPAFTGAVIRNIIAPPENILAKLDDANKKKSYVIKDGDFLKAAHNVLSAEGDAPAGADEPVKDEPVKDEPAKDEPVKDEPADEPPVDEPVDEPVEDAPADDPAVEDNSAPGEEAGAPEESPTPEPEEPVKNWKNNIKERLLKELGDDLIREFTEDQGNGEMNDLETLDESLIQPTASSALRKMWVFKKGWDNYLRRAASNLDKKSFDKLKFGTYMILNSNDLTVMSDYGYDRRDFLAVMSFIDQRFKRPLSLGVKKAIAELNGTKGLTLKDAVYSLQKLSSRKLSDFEIRKALTWMKAMDSYSD